MPRFYFFNPLSCHNHLVVSFHQVHPSPQNLLCNTSLSHACCLPRPHWFCHLCNACEGVHIIKLIMLSLPATVTSFLIGPNIFLSFLFSNNQPIFLLRCERPSFALMWKIWSNHCSVYFHLYIFERPTAKQRMLHRMVASIPWLQSAFNFFMNEILIFYNFSQIFEFSHTFKGLISYLCIVILFCIIFLKHEYIISFLSMNF